MANNASIAVVVCSRLVIMFLSPGEVISFALELRESCAASELYVIGPFPCMIASDI